MKQVLQSVRTGETSVADVPAPGPPGPNRVRVHVACSLVSAGTERMIVQFAEKNLLQKVRARPDLALQVIEKARREGVLTALQAVMSRLDQPMALGYSVAGTVVDAGSATPFRVGDRVACAGANYAVHAEIVTVPKNLVVPLPDTVGFEAACFTTLGAIALQGIRLADLQVGGSAAVIGLGLLGQLTVQILRASGVRVVGMDIDTGRAALALASGASATAVDPIAFQAAVTAQSRGRGVDAVLICADTPSNDPLELAAIVARDKGVVVAVGAVGLTVPRKPFFEKELDLRISRSYGPGRYDPLYEDQGQDYPYGHVRWTEQRNMSAIVDLMADDALRVDSLISHRFTIEQAARAFDLVTGKISEPFLAVVLQFPETADERRTIETAAPLIAARAVSLGALGAGLFASSTLFPVLKSIPSIELKTVSAGSGASAAAAARKFGFARATTDSAQVLADPGINTVAVLTRHSAHAAQVIAALHAGKHVFVEKPLCVTEAQLDDIVSAWKATRDAGPALMVGFNRRFAPFLVEIFRAVQVVQAPIVVQCRVNAGFIPATHWTQDPAEGGRLIGEGCHFVDLVTWLTRSRPIRVAARALPDHGRYCRDNVLLTIEYENGSLASVSYLAAGHKAAGKEWLEVHGGGLSAQMDDYRSLRIHHPDGQTTRRTAWLKQDKGHRGEWEALVAYLEGKGPDPMPFDQIVRSMRATFAAARSLASGALELTEA